MADFLESALGAGLTGVHVRTRLLPDVDVSDPFGAQGSPPFLVKLLQPQITLDTPAGPLVIAPAGAPGASLWPVLAIGGVVLAGVGLYLALK